MKTQYRIEIKRSSSEYAVQDENGNWPPLVSEIIYTDSDTYLRELAQAFFNVPMFPFMPKDFVLESLPLGKVFSIRGGVKGLTELGQEQNIIGVRVYVEAVEEEPAPVIKDLFTEAEPENVAEDKKPEPYYVKAALALAKRLNLLDFKREDVEIFGYLNDTSTICKKGHWVIEVAGKPLIWTLTKEHAVNIVEHLYKNKLGETNEP